MTRHVKDQTLGSERFGTLRYGPEILRFRLQSLAYLRRVLALLALSWMLTPTFSFAQIGLGAGGWVIQLTGMVQVEPGSNVLTLGVKDDVIRFAVNDVYSRDQSFSVPRFLSESRRRDPSLDLRGQDQLLDMLVKEKPGKRVLKLTGRYYQDSHRFVLDSIDRLEEKSTPR
jgi:hypothetical protein